MGLFKRTREEASLEMEHPANGKWSRWHVALEPTADERFNNNANVIVTTLEDMEKEAEAAAGAATAEIERGRKRKRQIGAIAFTAACAAVVISGAAYVLNKVDENPVASEPKARKPEATVMLPDPVAVAREEFGRHALSPENPATCFNGSVKITKGTKTIAHITRPVVFTRDEVQQSTPIDTTWQVPYAFVSVGGENKVGNEPHIWTAPNDQQTYVGYTDIEGKNIFNVLSTPNDQLGMVRKLSPYMQGCTINFVVSGSEQIMINQAGQQIGQLNSYDTTAAG